MRKIILSLLMLFIISLSINAQTKVDKYWDFINNNQNYNLNQLVNDHPIGLYKGNVPQSEEIQFYDSVCNVLQLTSYEKELINKHGFMVTERLPQNNCWEAINYIYFKDLPVLITTDFILDAVHVSYNGILKTIEEEIIIEKLSFVLRTIHENLYTVPGLEKNTNDLDVYLTVARTLLENNGKILCKYSYNQNTVNEIIELIICEQPATYQLFSYVARKIDFSQYKVRGHYTLSGKLGNYFKCMMWLSKTEFYLIPPVEGELVPKFSDEDIQRQIIDAYLLKKFIKHNNVLENYYNIDSIIGTMVGFSDNVQMNHLEELEIELNIKDITDFSNMETIHNFQTQLASKEYSEQKILSQILKSPYDNKQLKPASSFLLFGQRFILDSYICGNLVYDKIINDEEKIKRMLPSVSDVLFTLGNNPSLEFLKNELERYPYAKQLAATRLLIDNFDDTYWLNSFYGLWLNAIKTLNTPTPERRKKLPAFMQTAAWQQEKMNTQLASWAQLRHDNILYGKQSYSGGPECSYPYILIEPIPEFYVAIAKIGRQGSKFIKDIMILSKDDYVLNTIYKYYLKLDTVATKLKELSEKIINGQTFNESDKRFLYQNDGGMGYQFCVPVFPGGWIGSFYAPDWVVPDLMRENWQIIADIHTSPFDAEGNQVGWVKHAGTGHINLGVFIAQNYENKPTAYVGPVMSFMEYTTNNFQRLSDEDWKNYYYNNNRINFRPDFVDLYLADIKGGPRNDYPLSLPVEAMSVNSNQNESKINISTYPNPFTENVIISFKIPVELTGNNLNLSIFDLEGRLIKTLVNEQIQSGNYSIKWDALNSISQEIPDGTYICKLQIGSISETAKISCIRK